MKQAFCIFAVLLLCAGYGMAADAESIFKSSCAACHGIDGAKSAGGSTPLKGQSAEDITAKLQGYFKGEYGGKQKQVMENVVKKFSGEELKEVAAFAAKL